MQPPVDTWSSPTTVWAGGLDQLPLAVAGRRVVLVADARLTHQIELVVSQVPGATVIAVSAEAAAGGVIPEVADTLAADPAAVPLALGGGSVMDLVRLTALTARDPRIADRAATTTGGGGVVVLPTRVPNPTVCLPTTLGTASEVSPVAVRHRRDGVAMLVSPGLRSAGAVLDPALTASLTPAQRAAGLVEPWARVCVPAVAGQPLRLQDALARGLVGMLTGLGEEAAAGTTGAEWRAAAAQASVQTHLGLLAVGRTPAGHVLWPLAVELGRATGRTKIEALAALLPAWLDGLADGALGRAWGSAERVRTLLDRPPAQAATDLRRWLRGLGLATVLTGADVAVVTGRVVSCWQAPGLFLAGARPDEVAGLLGRSADS